MLDVRQPNEYENARIPGSKLIPLPNLNDRLSELDPQKPVIPIEQPADAAVLLRRS